ncbi:glycosyltransferase family 39 protein [Nocardia testacea]|uniref:Glycosyltransferase family 39 protein n=1 Tax=Nocardia testacea TaxID=248551 RepID=A0ABW7VPT8_9NOCA
MVLTELDRHTAEKPAPPGRTRPQWFTLIALLTGTAVLYLWDLTASGWANQFYSAAVQAGSVSWKAVLFGSSDAANAITVDKPPAALWVMDISARIFGVSPGSVLVPQALMGVAAVGVLYTTVRRVSGHWAGLLAGAVLALTPVAALMFRFNNPDALLVLLLTLAAYCVLRAIEAEAAWWWLPLAGVCVGFGFLAKMMQAFLALPAFAVVYLLAAAVPWRVRIGRSCAAVAAAALSAGWYLALVELWPDDSRPYIGGSQHNSLLELTFGYNGLGRLTGEEVGGLGNHNGDVGWDRLFGMQMGGQIAWLLPAAVLLGLGGLWMLRRAPRTDPQRAALLLWLGWLAVTGAAFSYAHGILHSYYTVALAPALAGAIGTGGALLWARRDRLGPTVLLAGTSVSTAVLAWLLLGRNENWQPWLAPLVLVAGLLSATALLVARGRRGMAVGGLAVTAALLAPTVYTLHTVGTPHGGALPVAGPAAGWPMHGPPPRVGGAPPGLPDDRPGGGRPGGPPTAPFASGRPANFLGGLLGNVTAAPQVVAQIEVGSDDYRWPAAVVGSNNAAAYQLATAEPVMAIGGYNGTDPAPTLAEFQHLVAARQVRHFIDSGMADLPRPHGGSDAAVEITRWVEQTFPARTLDGVTVYDLTEETTR